MKIGRKIALFYTLVTVLTTMAVIGVFYLFSSRYIDGLYRSYLREKAFLTAQKHWERDEVDEQSYQTIQRKYDELLPEAKEIDRKSTRLNSSHRSQSRMPSSA